MTGNAQCISTVLRHYHDINVPHSLSSQYYYFQKDKRAKSGNL